MRVGVCIYFSSEVGLKFRIPSQRTRWDNGAQAARVSWNQMGFFIPFIGKLTMSREGEPKSKLRKCIEWIDTLCSCCKVPAGLLWLHCTQTRGFISQPLRITMWYIQERELNSFSSKIYCVQEQWSFITTATLRAAEKNSKKGEIIIIVVIY